MTTEETTPAQPAVEDAEAVTLNPEDVGRLEDVLGEGDSLFQPAAVEALEESLPPPAAPPAPVDPAPAPDPEVASEIEREPPRYDFSHRAPAEAPSPAAATPPAAPPEAERGTSDGSLVCTVCLRLIGAGETYVQTAVRGANHLEPCSHRT